MIDLEILKSRLNNEDNLTKIIEIKNIFIKEFIHPLQEKIKTCASNEERKELGIQINNLKKEIEEIVQAKINSCSTNKETDTNASEEHMNLNIDVIPTGRQHLINFIINDIIEYLQDFNFKLVSDNEIANDYFNFTALNIPKNHPARNMHDSLFFNSEYLLRTHCTSNSAKLLHKCHKEKDIRIFSFGNVYRKDEDDATHSHQFTQVDLIWVRKDLSLANLKFLINGLINHLFKREMQTRYRLSFFPFTEPSFEVDVACWKCNQEGCNICKQSGWIEILGAGMLNQEVLKEAKIDETINSGLAAGIGIERIAMLKYNINDIRDLYNNDFDVLKQFPEE